MCQKGSKGGAPPRKVEGAKGSPGMRAIPEGLVEISHDCQKNWDDIIIALNMALDGERKIGKARGGS